MPGIIVIAWLLHDLAVAPPQLRHYKDGIPGATVNSTRLVKEVADNNCWLGRSNTTADNNLQRAVEELLVWDGAMFGDEIADSIAVYPTGQLAMHCISTASTRGS